MSHKIKGLAFVIAALSATATSMVVYAAGFQINEMSPKLQGSALAGAASSWGDVDAMYLNPASLGGVTANEVYLGGSYIDPKVTLKDASATQSGAALAGASEDGNVANSALVPNMYAVWKVNDKIVAGLSVTVPWGLETQYGNDWVGRYEAMDSKIESVAITPTIAFKLNDQWSLGVGVSAVRTKVTLSQYSGSASVLPATQPSTVSGDDWGYGYLLGIQYRPMHSTVLGLSYRSAVKSVIEGDASLSTAGVPAATGLLGSASADLELPAVWNLGITQKITSKWKVMANAQYVEWSSVQSINVNINVPGVGSVTMDSDLNYKNAWLFSLGSAYDLTPKWQLRFGAAFDQTPTNNIDRDARIPDSNRIWATIGVGYHIDKNFSVDAVYQRIFMQDSTINKTSTDALNNVQANYSGYANVFGLGLSWKF
ncbi:Putative outer membrane protein precursor [Piscirickettsia salmonis]|uniref:OmpP1/FadL family transporter n=1 Tax=Piscirickettsia salmonis TaxID=1238 RepID=UPI0012BA7469|nr:TonB-dependent receptor [Piscirickettsia salmonis]QGP55522.1 Putative outer membrane protein precursor [Piscirickettsia salmonis]QGP58632.1 Putative outer membrane protein precursor [Piscirickettsia salmonis]QGP65095.1 Putative outer membrane protein precursor [Piscirickettsia salmonis]